MCASRLSPSTVFYGQEPIIYALTWKMRSIEPVPGQEGLTFYKKNKELRKKFYAQEKKSGESKDVEAEKPVEEASKAPATEPPEPDDPEDPDDDEAIDRICEKIDENRKHHILQEHHCWKRLVKNPRENWSEIVKIIKEVIKNGKEQKRA